MSADQWGVVSIVVAIILAVPGYLLARSSVRKRQTQKVDARSVGIQAGGDVNIGCKND